MRSIATCYSENAIKVSDSYCSGPASSRTSISQHPTRPAPSSVTSTYKIIRNNSSLNSNPIFVTVNWSGCGGGDGGFSISVTDKIPSASNSPARQFRKPKGSKEFEACGCRIELLWNLSPAFYDAGPEPVSGFYVVVLIDSEPGLFLGDVEEIEDEEGEDGFRRGGVDGEKIRLAAELSPVSRIEKFVSGGSGRGSYSTRAQFSRVGEMHDVMINFGTGGDQSSAAAGMSVLIDGRRVFEVRRLRWNFRGNQTIFLDGIVVDVMWDLHDWSFKETGEGEADGRDRGGCTAAAAVFLFRTRSGLDSRLWLEEKILEQKKDPERAEFSLLICACKKPG
ncbi:unnamed protein product [Linum tenue]|uniref:DUF868 family protein n=1 Tax=Linum tenue TaxID=586396 RepID=A0AAV0PER6_9ROSI|nr:unnamed protein product [Linum tenue]